jgi:hypothetical protein
MLQFRKLSFAVAIVATFSSGAALADTAPLGAEFQITVPGTSPILPGAFEVARARNGNFIVVWSDAITSASQASLYAADGTPIVTQLDLPQYNGWGQNIVAMDANGNFVIVWEEIENGGADGYKVFAQQYDANGSLRGAAIDVADIAYPVTGNGVLVGAGPKPSVAVNAAGNFVVAWQNTWSETVKPISGAFDLTKAHSEAYVRLYNADGTSRTAAVQVEKDSPVPTVNFFNVAPGWIAPSVAMDDNVNVVVAWDHAGTHAGSYLRRYNAKGQARGAAVKVGSDPYVLPALLASASDGRVVAVWQSATKASYSDKATYIQRFAADGTASGSPVAFPAIGSLLNLGNVVSDPNGNFTVSGLAIDQSGHALGVFGQRYAADGTPQGQPVQFGPEAGTQLYGGYAQGAVDGNNELLAVWTDYQADVGQPYLVGRLFTAP